MRKRIVIGTAAALVLAAAVAAPILLAPGPATPILAATPIDSAEQAVTVDALEPATDERPVIAVITRNDGTEVADFLTAVGLLRRANVADVVVVAERDDPVQLYPAALAVEPDMTAAAFDTQYPEGADYVVVPAMDPGTDPFIAQWIVDQHSKGAKVVSICNGSRMIGNAGLLDGRRATAHWSVVAELRQKYPTMHYVPDRRYVSDNGVTTSTGISASIPTMLALVEAIGGREKAASVADDLGLTSWDARHRSASFVLGGEHKKTFIRNTLSFWRRDAVGIALADGVDEIALGLTADAWGRTQLADVSFVVAGGAPVRTAHGLLLTPQRSADSAAVDVLVEDLPAEGAATVLEVVLPAIAARYDRQTADIVTLVMEYPWSGAFQVAAR
jgi:putative intracellular protease/amidase